MGDAIIGSGERGRVASAEPGRRRRSDALLQGLGAFLIYLALALLFFGRGLLGHFSDRFIGREADPSQMMWLLAWWPYALSHHINPFLTNYVWAPVGFNFAWMTSTPLPALLAAPLTASIGLVATYNVLALLSAPAAAICTFALCRRVSDAFWASMLGGFVFGFSSFMLGQMLGHMCLILSFPVPLAAYLIARRLDGGFARRWFVALLTAVLISEFLIDLEMFATAIVVGILGLGMAYRFSSPEIRRRLLKLVPEFSAAVALTAFVVSPYLYYFFSFGMLRQPLWPSEKFSIDLLNFIVPTPSNLAGNIPLIAWVSSNFTGTVMERDGFVALPLILIAIVWARRHWQEPLCKSLVTSTLVVCICTIGPYLQINGLPCLPMPWLAISHLPFLEHALPSRLMVFPPLAIALIVSLWLADPRSRRELKLVAAALTIFLMLPNPSAQFWVTSVDTPQFFTDGSAQRNVSRADTILTLPWGSGGQSMLWQAQCGMCFRNVSGWTGTERFEVRRWPIVNYFGGSHDLSEPDLQLKAFLANNRITTIIIDDSDPHAGDWNLLVASTGIVAEKISGVSLYRIPAGTLKDSIGLTGLEMERRATQTRFDLLLSAVDRYLAAGNLLESISPEQLIQRGFLPASWKREPHGLYDLFVGPWADNGVVIGELASPSAISSLIDRYRDTASEVYLPYPKVIASTGNLSSFGRFVHNALLPPAAMPVDGESMEFVGIAFSREQLRKVTETIVRRAPPKPALPNLARR